MNHNTIQKDRKPSINQKGYKKAQQKTPQKEQKYKGNNPQVRPKS